MLALVQITAPFILIFLLSCFIQCTAQQDQLEPPQSRFPLEINLRAGVLHSPPFATVETQRDGTVVYGGFQPDLLKRLSVFAAADNVTLSFNLSTAPPQYGPAFDLVANDCATTVENPEGNCNQLDMVVGNYYATPDRALRADLSPAWLRSTISTVKFVDKDPTSFDYTTLTQASVSGATVCLKGGTFYAGVVKGKFPKVDFLMCPSQEDCLNSLKAEECVLYASDELELRYAVAWDASLEVTREHVNTQYIVWPLSFDLDPIVSILMKRWVFAAVTNATLDDLYSLYFQKALCPVGTAGERCELPCDPNHGEADAKGVCVCVSTKWAGADCSVEVLEETNGISDTLLTLAYSMLGINVLLIFGCAGWLFWQRKSTQVKVSQPFFLVMVLFGCMVSSSSIIAMAQEDEGYGPVPACMAIPWLYSVGFSITFGTLFAKIRRVYVIFKSAADMRRHAVTVQETLGVIGVVLLIDVIILIIWTVVDPLEWSRTVISADQFGDPLESEGFCSSEHWAVFAGVIAALHLLLLAVACCLCYVSRRIPTKVRYLFLCPYAQVSVCTAQLTNLYQQSTQFSEGKYVSIAMISNLQIFIVGVPILIILGTDSATSFFVRCVVIWMNDFAVVLLIFGNLIYSVHWDPDGSSDEGVKEAVGSAIQQYSRSVKISSGGRFNSISRLDSSSSRYELGMSNHSRQDSGHLENRSFSREPRGSRRSSFSSCDPAERIPPMILEGTESEERSKVCSSGIASTDESEFEALKPHYKSKATTSPMFDVVEEVEDETTSSLGIDGSKGYIITRPKDVLEGRKTSSLPSGGSFCSEEFVEDDDDDDDRRSQSNAGSTILSEDVGDRQSPHDCRQKTLSVSATSSQTHPVFPSGRPNQISPTNQDEPAGQMSADGNDTSTKASRNNEPESQLKEDASNKTVKTSGTVSTFETTANTVAAAESQ